MKLFINSPKYFTNEFGVDDEIYWFCRELCKVVSSGEYSDFLDSIAITPIVVPKEAIANGLYNEINQSRNKGKVINICKQIDYEQYYNANIDEKKKLIIECVLKSFKSVKGKGKIEYNRLENDLFQFLKIT